MKLFQEQGDLLLCGQGSVIKHLHHSRSHLIVCLCIYQHLCKINMITPSFVVMHEESVEDECVNKCPSRQVTGWVWRDPGKLA